MSVTRAKITVNVEIIEGSDVGDRQRFVLSQTFNYTIGTGANSLNKQWNDADRVLPGGGTETHDLNGGLTNIFGAVNFTDMKFFLCRNPDDGASLTLGGGSNAFDTLFTGTVILPPGSLLIVATSAANGWAVDAGTGDQLAIAGTATEQYTLAMGGE